MKEAVTSKLSKRVGSDALLVRAEHIPADLGGGGGRRTAGLHGHPSRKKTGRRKRGWVLEEGRGC